MRNGVQHERTVFFKSKDSSGYITEVASVFSSYSFVRFDVRVLHFLSECDLFIDEYSMF